MKRHEVPHGAYFKYVGNPVVYVHTTTRGESFRHACNVLIHPSDRESAGTEWYQDVVLLDGQTLQPIQTLSAVSTSAAAEHRGSGPAKHAGDADLRDGNNQDATNPADPTNPSHYRDLSIEPIDAIESWGLGYNLGNVVAYIARAGRKPEQSGSVVPGGLPKGTNGEVQSTVGAGDLRASSVAGNSESLDRRGSGLSGGVSGPMDAGRRADLRGEGRRQDLRKALKYLIREITGLDGDPSWDYENIRPIRTGGVYA